MLVNACSKNDESDILEYLIVNQQADVEIDGLKREVNLTFPETTLNGRAMVAQFTLSEGAMAYVNNVDQISGKTSNDYDLPFYYDIVAENEKDASRWKVSAANNAFTLSWGLGGFQQQSQANNRSYEWYIDQFGTGQHSGNNCGPASTTMSARWSFPAFSKTTADARAAYRPEGGWWYTNDINMYLTDNNIPHSVISLSSERTGTEQIIKTRLSEGYILILCLDMFYVRNEADSKLRVDKFYTAASVGWGHFIVLKGYREVNDKVYFEVYDPYCNSLKYSDGTLKGKDRYYRSEDIFSATSKWWNYAIVISQAGDRKGVQGGLDPSTVPVQWGR
jgi:hypothetical protein